MISASPRRLSVFKSVVDHGGFNVAAIQLGIAQPSVGAHIKALESQLGQPLFYRHRGSKPRLTKAGEALYAFTIDALKKSEEASRTLSDLRSAEASEITIAAHRDIASHLLSTRLTAFAAKFPRIRIVTRIGTIEDVLELVRNGRVHIALLLASGPLAGLRSDVLATEPLALVVAPQHPLARAQAVASAALSEFPFVTGLRQSSYFQIVDRALKKIGVAQYRIAMELQESPAVKDMVRHGAGIACLLRCTVDDEIRTGALTVVDLATPLQSLELRCAYREPIEDLTWKFVSHLRNEPGPRTRPS